MRNGGLAIDVMRDMGRQRREISGEALSVTRRGGSRGERHTSHGGRKPPDERAGAAPDNFAKVAKAKNPGAPLVAASANSAAPSDEPMTNEGGVAGPCKPVTLGLTPAENVG